MGMPRLLMSPETAPKAVEFQCSSELFRYLHGRTWTCLDGGGKIKVFQCSSELFRYFHSQMEKGRMRGYTCRFNALASFSGISTKSLAF